MFCLQNFEREGSDGPRLNACGDIFGFNNKKKKSSMGGNQKSSRGGNRN